MSNDPNTTDIELGSADPADAVHRRGSGDYSAAAILERRNRAEDAAREAAGLPPLEDAVAPETAGNSATEMDQWAKQPQRPQGTQAPSTPKGGRTEWTPGASVGPLVRDKANGTVITTSADLASVVPSLEEERAKNPLEGAGVVVGDDVSLAVDASWGLQVREIQREGLGGVADRPDFDRPDQYLIQGLPDGDLTMRAAVQAGWLSREAFLEGRIEPTARLEEARAQEDHADSEQEKTASAHMSHQAVEDISIISNALQSIGRSTASVLVEMVSDEGMKEETLNALTGALGYSSNQHTVAMVERIQGEVMDNIGDALDAAGLPVSDYTIKSMLGHYIGRHTDPAQHLPDGSFKAERVLSPGDQSKLVGAINALLQTGDRRHFMEAAAKFSGTPEGRALAGGPPLHPQAVDHGNGRYTVPHAGGVLEINKTQDGTLVTRLPGHDMEVPLDVARSLGLDIDGRNAVPAPAPQRASRVGSNFRANPRAPMKFARPLPPRPKR